MIKRIVTIASVALLFSVPAYAGVSKIQSNGKISGASSYRVQCSSGSSHVIYKKNGTWYTGGGGHMGNKYNSWSTEKVAQYLCS